MTLNKLTTLTNGQHVGELTTWQTCTGSYPSERFNRTVLLSKKKCPKGDRISCGFPKFDEIHGCYYRLLPLYRDWRHVHKIPVAGFLRPAFC